MYTKDIRDKENMKDRKKFDNIKDTSNIDV